MNLKDFVLSHSALSEKSVQNTIQLLSEGSTVPFIARYRKEMTGALDEVQIALIRDLVKKYEDLINRQGTILKAIEEQNKMTDELRVKISTCFDSALLEDLYLPFKQKRLTRGEKAKKLGLEPLAKMILSQNGGNPFQMAGKFVRGQVADEEMAIEGAKDIMAEFMNENVNFRVRMRTFFNVRQF
jgi:uncharacterized protein